MHGSNAIQTVELDTVMIHGIMVIKPYEAGHLTLAEFVKSVTGP